MSIGNRSGKLLRTLLPIFALLTIGMMTGCQSDSTDDLPPLRLTGPQIAPAGEMMAMPARYTPPPSPMPAKLASPVHHYYSADSSSGVPADWIPRVAANNWKWIIIHHSDSDSGSAAIIDGWHRQRGFDELGYHFVIDNGHGNPDGLIEVGPRWPKQKWGAHDNALDNRFNTNGIGICLVGNFNKTHPTAAQRRSLIRLVVYLMKTYHIPASHVLGHGETKDTQCPGRYLSAREIRESVSAILSRDGKEQDEELANVQY
jgi:hypothetical protein